MERILKVWVGMREQTGQSMAEYALIMGVVAVVVYAAYQHLGTQISAYVTTTGNNL